MCSNTKLCCCGLLVQEGDIPQQQLANPLSLSGQILILLSSLLKFLSLAAFQHSCPSSVFAHTRTHTHTMPLSHPSPHPPLPSDSCFFSRPLSLAHAQKHKKCTHDPLGFWHKSVQCGTPGCEISGRTVEHWDHDSI